jgi:hypothetical protein
LALVVIFFILDDYLMAFVMMLNFVDRGSVGILPGGRNCHHRAVANAQGAAS